MNINQIIEIVVGCLGGVGLIISFILTATSHSKNKLSIKSLRAEFEAAKAAWIEKENEYKNNIATLKNTIVQQQIQLARYEETLKLYQSKLIAYENRTEAKIITDLENKLKVYEAKEDNSAIKEAEFKKALEIASNNNEALKAELLRKEEVIKRQNQEIEGLNNIKKSAEEISGYFSEKFKTFGTYTSNPTTSEPNKPNDATQEVDLKTSSAKIL